MTRTLMVLTFVATLFATIGTTGLSIASANAVEQSVSNYCQNIPESLLKTGFVPGICR